MARKPGPEDGAEDAPEPVGTDPDGVLELGSYAVRGPGTTAQADESLVLGPEARQEPGIAKASADPVSGSDADSPDTKADDDGAHGDGVTAAAPTDGPVAADAHPKPRSPHGPGTGALVLGGAVAAALGFGAAWVVRDAPEVGAPVPADLEQRIAALEAGPATGSSDARFTDLDGRLTALEQVPADEGDADLEAIHDALAALETRADDLAGRVDALEDRPAGGGSASRIDTAGSDALGARVDEIADGLAQAQRSLDGLANRVDEVEAQSAAAIDEVRAATASLSEARAGAEAARTEAQARAALTAVESAIEAGEPFEAPLSDLAGASLEVPDPLARLAADGVPTLAELEADFPDAARAALATARDEGLVDDGRGVMGFLRGQLSLRSTAPREGDDPDAVLSRAQALLEQGRLDAALSAVGSLPAPVQAAMRDWTARAQARAEADAALSGLRDSLSAPDGTIDDAPAD